MKISKIIISLFIFLSCVPIFKVSALETNDDMCYPNIIYYPSEEEFEKEEQKEIEKMKSYFERSRENYTYDYRKVGDAEISGLSPYKEAYNQPAGGTSFPTVGSGFWWADSSYSPGTWSFGMSLSGKYISINAAYSPGTVTAASGGANVDIYPNQVGKFVKLMVARTYKVQRYDVYRKPQYSGSWTYVSSYATTTKYGRAFEVVEV